MAGLVFGGNCTDLLYNGIQASAYWNGIRVWPPIPMYTVSIVADATATAYASAIYQGELYSAWETNDTNTAEIPSGSILYIRTETPNYYRHSGISSNCSDFISGVNSGFGRSLTGSGYVTSDSTASVNGTNTNKFTATGGFQACGNDTGRWRPHTLAYLNTTYSFVKSGISGSFASQGANGTWSYVTLGAANRLLTGVPFSSFSAYVSSYGSFGKVNQTKTAYCTAGVVVQGHDYAQGGSYATPRGPYGLTKTINYTTGTFQSTTAINNQISIYAKIDWNGMAAGLSTNGKWSATGIAP